MAPDFGTYYLVDKDTRGMWLGGDLAMRLGVGRWMISSSGWSEIGREVWAREGKACTDP